MVQDPVNREGPANLVDLVLIDPDEGPFSGDGNRIEWPKPADDAPHHEWWRYCADFWSDKPWHWLHRYTAAAWTAYFDRVYGVQNVQ